MASTPAPVALITGGNRGIGLAIAQQLGARGMRVVVGTRSADKGTSTAKALTAQGANADWIELNAAHDDSRRHAVEQLLEREGRIDILVNNAGVALDKWVPTQELELEVLKATMETNLYGPLRLSQLLLPPMIERGYGRIVNISSELGSLANTTMGGSAAYRISKTALNMLTKLLAAEVKDHPNILINAAAPGWVKTELGGDDANRTPEEGAKTPVWLATLPEGGPSGGFFRDEAPYPW